MAIFIRNRSSLFRQLLFGTTEKRTIQQQFKYSQKTVAEPVVNRKKKYIYTAFIGTSLIAFSYYVYKEKEYGKILLCVRPFPYIAKIILVWLLCDNFLRTQIVDQQL